MLCLWMWYLQGHSCRDKPEQARLWVSEAPATPGTGCPLVCFGMQIALCMCHCRPPLPARGPAQGREAMRCLPPRVMAMLPLSLLPLLPLPLPALAPLPPPPDSSELPDPEPTMAPPPLCARACCTSRHVASSATLTAVLLPMAVRLQKNAAGC